MNNLNALVQGDDDNVMENLNALSAREMQRRDKLKQQRQTEIRNRDLAREALRNKMEAERTRLEQQPILSRKVADFESLVRMRTELYGNGTEVADCLWNQLKQVAGSDESGVLATYFVAIGGGDFDQPPEHRPYMDKAQEKLESYMSSRDSCY